MANPKHLARLKRGTQAWNQWRAKHRILDPDLADADLSSLDLSFLDLRRANLNGANLDGAVLSNSNLFLSHLQAASLRSAKLEGANLSEASLERADITGADLSSTALGGADFFEADGSGAALVGADLFAASLRSANLSGANLGLAILRGVNLTETNLNGATIGTTVFANVDLSVAKGLDTVRHSSPSTVGIDTIFRSNGKIPESFLRGCGVPDEFSAYAKSLAANPIEFYSCFISYSSKDDAFATELHSKLQTQQVRCWKDSEDLKIGDRFQEEIERAIRLYDKLLLVLSENSIDSAWVEREVQAAFEKERRQGSPVLFPVRLDDAVMSCSLAWAADIRRTRHIGDFRKWKNHGSFEKSLTRLLRDLSAKPK